MKQTSPIVSSASALHSFRIDRQAEELHATKLKIPAQLWLHWTKRAESSPLHRKAWGSLWCTTDEAGNSPYSVDLLKISVEMPNLVGGVEKNTDEKAGSRVDAFCEAYGTSFVIPSFTTHYRLLMRTAGFYEFYKEDQLSI